MRKKVLVVEDDKSIVEVVTIILESEGYDVHTASHKKRIDETIIAHKPDVILLDIQLFGEDGGKIAKELKSKEYAKHIPIIMMSANNDTKKIAKDCGADDFLLKPFNINDLTDLVSRHSSR